MNDLNSLRRGHWVRSAFDLIKAMSGQPLFWFSGALFVASLVITIRYPYPEFELTSEQVTANLMYLGSLLCFAGMGFFIFRRMNAELLNRAALYPPLGVVASFVEGTAYSFGMDREFLDEKLERLLEKVSKQKKLERKRTKVRQKASQASASEREEALDLAKYYDKEIATLERSISTLADDYHVPTLELELSFRLHNPARYRLAHVLNITPQIDFPSEVWKFVVKGVYSLDGSRLSFPMELKPGESMGLKCKVVMEPRSGLNKEKFEAYIKRQQTSRFPVELDIECDDTYGGVAVTTLQAKVSFKPLKDKLDDHWKRSEFC